MKQLKQACMVALIAICTFHFSFGQSTTPGNTWGGGANEYLGWDNASATPLEIKTEQAQHINFYTGAGAGGFANQRMIIRGNNGRVGIGFNFTTPQARLDIREPSGTLPTLRLTYSTSSSLWTDFMATSAGDLTIFAQNGTAQANVFVGDPSLGTPAAALHVINMSMNSSSQNGLRVIAAPATNSGFGIAAYSTLQSSAGTTTPTYAFYGLAKNSAYQSTGVFGQGYNGSNKAVGGYFKGAESDNNYGVFATGDEIPGANNYGVYGQALTGNSSIQNNYGVYGYASTTLSPSQNNYGVYGKVIGGSGGGAVTNYAGYFNGDVWITGAGWILNGTPIASDAKLKSEITPIDNADVILAQLHPVSYYYDTVQYQFLNLSSRKQYGLIAQDVEPILPDVVFSPVVPAEYDTIGNMVNDSLHIKALNYTELIPYLIAGHQSQDSKIQELQNQNDYLQAQLDACCGMGLRSGNPNNANSQSVNLVTKVQIQLGNAAPNPNGGITSIPFQLPQSVVKAEMVFTDLLGQEVNRVELGARGFSKINVTTTQLEDGTYNYTLIADGKVIDTKQMVKQH